MEQRGDAPPIAAAGARVAAAAAEAVIGGYEAAPAHDPGRPAMWSAPMTWMADGSQR